ncbi:MAG: polysaccharide biosynthesis tyrosine autokinase [Bdellovibrionota bacterium]|nr:MAG: polysaccharide biosynthesis tyrosine autokinase [Bdellovibrionota bacterium]
MNQTNDKLLPTTAAPGTLTPQAHSSSHRGAELYEPQLHSEPELRIYWQVLVKYRWLIVFSVVVFGLLALIYAFTVTPRYTAESKIRISTYEPVLTATKIEDLLQQKSKEANYLETQIEELRSYSLADRVLTDPDVHAHVAQSKSSIWQRFFSADEPVELDTGTLNGAHGYQHQLKYLRGYLDLIRVKPVRRTSLVGIEATTESPELSALVANRHAEEYIEWVRKGRVEQQSRALTFLQGQADELRQRVADLEREMADYAEANSIVAVNKDENITVQKMSQLNQLLTEATAKRIETENAFKRAAEAIESSSAGFDDSSVQSIRSELARLEAEKGQLLAKFTPQYPRVQQIEAQIVQLRTALKQQRQEIVRGLESKYQAALQEEATLKEELEQQKSRAFELSKRSVSYNSLDRDLTSSRELLQNVLRQIKETSLAVESNSSNVAVVDRAAIPMFPSFPNKKLLLGLGLLLGAGVGVALAFLLNYLDDTVRTPEQVGQLLALPTLGVIPSFALEELDSAMEQAKSSETFSDSDLPISTNGEANLPIAFHTAPKSLAAEAYRTIRTGILLSQAGQPPRTILVSSAQSSEGKTTSSVNLAACLASAGGRVALIDADLRRPSVHKHLRVDPTRAGLVDVITGQATLDEVAVRDVVKRITFIPSGRTPPNPAELLGSLEMANLLDQLAATHDYVIIDSAPVLPVTDSVILSRYVDGVVLVVKAAGTPRKVVRDARDRLKSVGARFLGAVLNDVDITSGDYYYYNRYYYSYYNRGESGEGHSIPRAASGR